MQFSGSSPIRMAMICVLAAGWLGDALAQGLPGRVVLKVGSDLTYPPYNYRDEQGKPAGFDVELMSALGRAIEQKIDFRDTRFEHLIPDVRAGRIDVIASTLYAKTERESEIDFIPYMRTGISIAVSAASGHSFKKPDDLCGHRVGSIRKAAWLEKLVRLNELGCYGREMQLLEFPTSPDATRAVLDGTADAQVEDSAVLQQAVDKLGGRLMISSTENFYPVVVGLGVRKGDVEMATLMRRGLRKLQANGCYGHLIRKYNVSKPRLAEFYLPLEDAAAIETRRRQGGAACP